MDKKRYWLRGGGILILIFIILVLVQGVIFGKWTKDFASYSPSSSIELLTEIPGQIILSPTNFMNECIYQSGPEDYSWCPKRTTLNLIMYLGSLISYFLIGSIVGFIYGKIKNRGNK